MSPAVSLRLPLSTTRLSILPNTPKEPTSALESVDLFGDDVASSGQAVVGEGADASAGAADGGGLQWETSLEGGEETRVLNLDLTGAGVVNDETGDAFLDR